MWINNVGAVVIALTGPDQHSDSTEIQSLQRWHVAAISIASCIGRIGFGILSDAFARAFHVSRVFWVGASAFVMAVGFGFAIGLESVEQGIDSLGLVQLVSLLIGTAYGAIMTCLPVVLVDFYGLKR